MEEKIINFLARRYHAVYVKIDSESSLKRIYDLYDQDILFEPINDIEMLYLGFYYEKQNNIPNMLKYYKQAVKLGNYAAMNNLGFYYKKQNDIPNMLKYYNQAVKLGNYAAMNNLGFYYKKQNDIPNMLKYYNQAIGSGCVEAMNNLGKYYQKQDDIPNMLKYYKQAIGSGCAKAMNNLKNYYNEHNQYTEAVILFHKYSKLDQTIIFLEKLVRQTGDMLPEILDIIESMDSDLFKNTSCGLRTFKQLLSQKIDMMHLHFEYSENGKGFQEAREDFINQVLCSKAAPQSLSASSLPPTNSSS